MREIKFRGKRVDKKEWAYGFLYIHNGYSGTSALIRGDKILDTKVDIKTIGQYTGLKDENGVEIYEGDIVKCKLVNQINRNGKWINEDVYENYEVIFSKEDLGFRFKDQWMSIWKFEKCELEVIGNIYDNKELLKKEGK